MGSSTLTRQIDDLVAELRESGTDKMPPERDLSERFQVSRRQVRSELDRLERNGVVHRVVGRGGGAFLVETETAGLLPPILLELRTRKVQRHMNETRGVPALLADQGFTARTKVLREGLEQAPSVVAAALEIDEGAPVFSLLRLRYADEIPLSLERMYLDSVRFPELLEHSPIASLYGLLRDKFAVRVARTHEIVEAIPVSRSVAALLGVRRDSSVLALRRTAFAADETPVETSIDLFRSDRTRLLVDTLIPRESSGQL